MSVSPSRRERSEGSAVAADLASTSPADFSAACRNFRTPGARLQREWLRLLSGVAGKRFTSGINTQLLGAARAELVLREHTQHRFAQYLFGTALQQHPDGNFLEPTRKTTVMVIDLLIDLVTSQFYLLGVDHHHVIPAIQIGREIRFVLAD